MAAVFMVAFLVPAKQVAASDMSFLGSIDAIDFVFPAGGGVFNGSFSSATDDDWLVFAANRGDLLTLTGNSVGFFTNGVLLQDTGDGNFQVGDAVNVLNFNKNNIGLGSPLQILNSDTSWEPRRTSTAFGRLFRLQTLNFVAPFTGQYAIGLTVNNDSAEQGFGSYTITLAGNTGTVGGGPDHFLCYKAKEKSGTPKFQKVIVDLEDQFGLFLDVEVEKPKMFCNPVDKNDEGINDPTAHLTCYKVKRGSEPKLPKRVVQTDDQFGELTLKIGSKPKTLCVPSEKDGVASELRLDHFQWYKAKEKSGTPKFEKLNVDLEDQFGTFLDMEVEKPEHLGTPTDKNGEGILNEESYLTCYKVKQASGTPKLPKRVVSTLDQFGELTLKLGSKPKTLCVPSTKTLIP
jgi:hypothetical protein